MDNQELTTVLPQWARPIIPGNATQGNILVTKSDFTNPPDSQELFEWLKMEDLIGTANIKLEYDEQENRYSLYKAKGHRDNMGKWDYEWELVGQWDALTPDVVEILKALNYVDYVYDTEIANTLKVYGVNKDGTQDLLVDINFASTEYVDQAIAGLKRVVGGVAIETEETPETTALNLKYNNDDLEVNSSNELQLKDIFKLQFKYVGEVLDKTFLPDNAKKGDVYGITNESDMYVNISNTTTPNFVAFTKIAESFTAYAVELHKSNNGLYAQLRYDDIDFAIDNFYNLKSLLIDDTLDASSPLASRRVYSISKILSLLTSIYRYCGQVNYYDQLPTIGNKVGDTYNVVYVGTSAGGSTELDGDNYAWNGSGWDDLSGEYRAGAGIVINGKIISATGISFIVGDGLQATGSGSTTTLSARITNGIEFVNLGTPEAPVNALGVKKGSGIVVNSNGVNVKTGETTKTDAETGSVEVNYKEGLTQNNNGQLKVNVSNGLFVDADDILKIFANFNIKSTPLGTESSKIALYSDGKMGVDFTESPVVLSGELLYQGNCPNGSGRINNITVPNFKDYDMFYCSFKVSSNGTIYSTLCDTYFQKPTGTTSIYASMIRHKRYTADNKYQGMAVFLGAVDELNPANGHINFVAFESANSFLADTGNWTEDSASNTRFLKFEIYGMRAR